MKKLTHLLLEILKEDFHNRDESRMSEKHIKFRKEVISENMQMDKTLELLRSYRYENI